MEEFFAPFFFFSCRVRRYIPPMAVRDEYRNKNESIMQIGGLADKHAPFKAGDLKSFSSRPAHPTPLEIPLWLLWLWREIWSQSYDRDLQRQRRKKLQRNE
jgi:hypothetical protein